MRCKTCDYPLWNLTTRTCPECGAPFYPSDFEFTVNAVQFLCRHCQLPYYGTGQKGHLEPQAFECVQCHERVTMDEMVLLPAEGVQEQLTVADAVPWLQRHNGQRVRAWLRTVGLALFNPSRLIRSLPSESSVVQAWWFATVTSLLIVVAWFIPFVALALGVPFMLAGAGGGGPGGGGVGALVGMAMGLFCFMAALIVGILVGVGLWSLLAHGLLRMTGATGGTLRRTVQVICYSSGAHVASATPCAGPYFGWIWWVVSAIMMTRHAHNVRTMRAVFAVGGPPVLLVTVLVGGYMTFIFWMIGVSSTTMTSAVSIRNSSEMQIVLSALTGARLTQSTPLRHGLELWELDLLSPDDFVGWTTLTTTDDIPVSSTDLGSLTFATELDQREAIADAITALPADVVAHRVGDFVFTFHGIDPSVGDPELWLVVMTPDPSIHGLPADTDFILIGFADGRVTTTTYLQLWTADLLSQNAYRATVGLAPLPDPAALTHHGTPFQPPPDQSPMDSGEGG